jgi:hypothetical protein
VKLVADLTTFCLVNGVPGDSISDFVRSLLSAEKEDRIRLAALRRVRLRRDRLEEAHLVGQRRKSGDG